jgi:hypothetical protein
VSPPLAAVGEVICGRVSDVKIMVEEENKGTWVVLKGCGLAKKNSSFLNPFSFIMHAC